METRRNRIASSIAALALAVALPACGDDSGTDATSPTVPVTAQTTARTQGGAGAPGTAEKAGTVIGEPGAGPGKVELYFTSGEQFEPVERPAPRSGDEIEAVAEELVAGPTAAEADRKVEVQTAIPAGTEVRSVRVSDDGTAEVSVSRRFLGGLEKRSGERVPGWHHELDARVGQIAQTMAQFDRVERTKVTAGGVSVASTGPADLARPQRPGPASRERKPARPERAGAERPGRASVRRTQRRLARLRYLPKSAIDGVDGYRTQQAVIAFQAWEKLDRDGVVGPITKAALADAERPEPKLGGPSKRVEVYREKGVALLVKHGRTKRAIHVSAGAAGTETPRGRFEVFRKELNSWSVPFQTWLPYASYFFQGIALHEYPDVPPYPASHGCVRVPSPEAEAVYRFARLGTAVAVR